MKNRKLMFSLLMCLYILINIPAVLCMTSAPVVYVAGDGSGDFNCNGTDDQIQINQALQFVAENSDYTTVYLKGPFTYIVNDTLLIGNNTILEGDPTAVIKPADNAGWTQEKSFITQMDSTGHNITIKSFTVDGNREGIENITSRVTLEQASGIEWQKCLGGSSFDYGTSVQQTSDGGYIVAGGSYSNDGDVTGNHGSQDSWVVKLDESGDIVWQKCLGGSSSDYGGSIEQTSDGGYVVAGFSNSNDGDVTGNHGSQDSWVVKLDESGDLVWQKCLGGSSSDYVHNIKQTSDGGYIAIGYSTSNNGNVTGNHGDKDSWVVKLDESGDLVWQKCLGGSSSDFGSSIKQTSDGGYIVAGGSNSNDGDVTGNHGDKDSWVVKLDESGNVVWQKCLGGSSSEAANCVEQTSDGGYIVSGYSNSNDGDVTGNHGSQDSWVVKLDESGDLVWQKCLGGSSIDYGNGIEQTSDGGYIVSGYSNSNDGDVTGNHGAKDSWVVKLDENGDLVWQKCLGGSLSDYGRNIEQTSDGGYIVAGHSTSIDGNVIGNNGNDDYWVVKLVYQAPVADFSAIPTSGSAPLKVSFTDNSTDNPTSWLWDFGDGANSIEQNPVHTYSTEGNYTVNLTVSNESGTDSKYTVVTVFGKPEPVLPAASFSADITSGYAPLSVQFNDTSTGAPTSWEWNFGDGSPNSTEQNPSHTYSSAGTYTVVLSIFNAEGSSTNKQTNFITVLNNSNSGSLTLVNTDFSELSSIPRGMYPESNTSNVTSTYNSTLECADITYTKPATGSLFFTNLYPATDSNITYTLGTEGVSGNSYVNIIASNSLIAVSKRANGDYRITSYWIADDKSTKYSYITVPAANIIDNKVTFSVVCYESNRTNVLKYNDTIYTKTPFRTTKSRNQNYVFVNQPMIYFSSYIASSDTGPFTVHLYSIKQEIPRRIITPYGTRSISAFTLSYPDAENNGNGTELMKSNGQKSTIYASSDHLGNATVAYQKALLDEGWELGVYYTINFNSVSNETAIATMDSEYNTIVNTFGKQPKTWTALGGSGNISQAIYAYQRYRMIWRTCESGASWLSFGNLCNPYWHWWNTSIAQGVVFPAFTIQTDNEAATGSSIHPAYFTMFSNGFAANNIRLCGLNEYYFTQSAQNTTLINIMESNNSYMRFTVNTSGYPCTLNVMTDMSNVEISHDGLTVPYTSVDDGLVFTANNNTTYVLRALPSSPVANFTSNSTSGIVPFTVQFNDTSAGSPISWDWNFGDRTHSDTQNATHTFTTAGFYNVTLTVSKGESSSTIMKTITVLEQSVFPVANFSTNVSEGYAPLSVQFNDSSKNATSVSWDFDGDGNSDSGDGNPVHKYTSPGTYTVNLTVGNENGADSKLATITVLRMPEPLVLPVAHFSTNVTKGYAPLSVQFTDFSEHAVSWSWDFNNDGRIDSSDINPVYSYAVPGIYTVKLTVANADGRSTKVAKIKVLEQPEEPVLPEANFSSSVSEGYAPLSVQFTDYSKHTVSWNWDFDNNGQVDSTSKDPGYLYSAPGVYTVKLTVANKNGTDSMSATVRVLERSSAVLPVANFSSNVTEGYSPLTVQFTDSSENAAGVTWDFNYDGIVDSISRTPVHVYTAPGTYNVNLTAVNENGRAATKIASITVLERSSSSGGSSSGGRGSRGGSSAGSSHEPAKNVEVKEFSQSFITGGAPVKFEFPKNATSIMSITFDSKKTAGETTTIVEMLKDKSKLTPNFPQGDVYGYFNTRVGNRGSGIENNIENAVINFRVEKSWVEENSIDKASIFLNRYNDSKWNPLPTSLSGEDDRYLYFTAETPGFSFFAITGKTTVKRIELQPEINASGQNYKNPGADVEQGSDQEGSTGTSGTSGKRMPGFGAIYGITGLLAVFQYGKKTKMK